MGWLLNILAIVLFMVIAIIDQFIRIFTKRSNKSAYSSAYKLNVFGNETFADSFNLMFCKKGFNEFGKFGEPLSSVFGRAYLSNRLNIFGQIIRKLIDIFDFKMMFKGKSHTMYWIRSTKEINDYIATL